jgi:hypothetical protein
MREELVRRVLDRKQIALLLNLCRALWRARSCGEFCSEAQQTTCNLAFIKSYN